MILSLNISFLPSLHPLPLLYRILSTSCYFIYHLPFFSTILLPIYYFCYRFYSCSISFHIFSFYTLFCLLIFFLVLATILLFFVVVLYLSFQFFRSISLFSFFVNFLDQFLCHLVFQFFLLILYHFFILFPHPFSSYSNFIYRLLLFYQYLLPHPFLYLSLWYPLLSVDFLCCSCNNFVLCWLVHYFSFQLFRSISLFPILSIYWIHFFVTLSSSSFF